MSHPLDGTRPAPRCACGHHCRPDEVTECRFCDCKDHRPARDAPGSPYQGYDPQTPAGAEAAVQAFSDALEPVRQALAEAVDAEADAELDLEVAKARLILSDECPVVGVFGGVRVTVAQRDAWVLLRTTDEVRALKKATAARKIAEKALDVTGRKLMAQQSITRSVGGSYGASGRSQI